MKITIIGAGRLGSAVGRGLASAGFDVRVIGRGTAVPAADVYWLTVRDAQIREVSHTLPAGGVRLHSAGALGIAALGDEGERGVLHPLMSFQPGGGPVEQVHARVSGTAGAIAVAQTLCNALGWQPFFYDGDSAKYHAAACMASGHLATHFLDAADLLVQGGMPLNAARERLLSLAIESLRNAAGQGDSAITGPAVRNDITTIDSHRAVLGSAQLPAYNALTDRILGRRG